MKKPIVAALSALIMGALAMPVVGAEASSQAIQKPTQATSNPLAKEGTQVAGYYVKRVGPRGVVRYYRYTPRRYYYRHPYYYRHYYNRPYQRYYWNRW